MELTINLTRLIEQAAGQIFGSDERDLLFEFLDRNNGREQLVRVDFSTVREDDEPEDSGDIDNHLWTCPICRQPICYDHIDDTWRCGCKPYLSRGEGATLAEKEV